MGDWSTRWFCAWKVGSGFIFKLVSSDVGMLEVSEKIFISLVLTIQI